MLRALSAVSIATLSCVPASCLFARVSHAQNNMSTIPTARSLPTGYMELKFETLDPFVRTTAGMQVTDRLYAGIRQEAYISSLNAAPLKLYPGLDFKFTLLEERMFMPKLALGLNSAIGQSTLASEYIVGSKRAGPFDFSAGMAWGKLGSAAHTNNPLGFLSSRFEKNRPVNDEDDNGPSHWFTGPDVGFFAGVAYQTPWKPLQLNAEWGADRYAIEHQLTPNYNAPNPWSTGATLKAFDHFTFHGALVGGEKLMGRLSYARNLSDLDTKRWEKNLPQTMRLTKKQAYQSSHMGLTGKNHSVSQRQLRSNVISPEEVWHGMETRAPDHVGYFDTNTWFQPKTLRVRFEQKFDMQQETTALLFRNAVIVDNINETVGGVLAGFGLRLNIENDLPAVIPASSNKLTRRDAVLYADKRINMERAFLAKNHSFGDVHTQIAMGYLEEMYAGAGGQILYRPYGKRLAIGAEAWDVVRRDPFSDFGVRATSNSQRWTGHINTYYELGDARTTIYGRVGRYLAEDFGATLGVSKYYNNGAKLNGYVTSTNAHEIDIFGGESDTFAGIRVQIPFERKKYMPAFMSDYCCDTDVSFEPINRDTGQLLNHPLPLYETSEPLSYRHLIRHWPEVKP